MQDSFRRSRLTRRSLLQLGAVATATYVFPRNLSARAIRRQVGSHADRYQPIDPVTTQALVLAAVDAAKAAGATYAEARVTRTVDQHVKQQYKDPFIASDTEGLGLGVRVLVNGGWGFASSPYWHIDEAAALAREAVMQAKVNSTVSPNPVDFGKYTVASGTWTTPGIDPFQVPIEEKLELCRYIRDYYDDIPRLGRYTREAWLDKIQLYRQERIVASSEGTLITQTLYRSGGVLGLKLKENSKEVGGSTHQFDLCGAGWDRFNAAELESILPTLVRRSSKVAGVGIKPVDVGRYDVVCDARTMANLVHATLGNASQLDRALGYEANATGTSYLGPNPLELLGMLQLGSKDLTITADRSMPRGLATVKWDDEGVEPDTATIVNNGVLHDYQTTREQASWLAAYYQQQGMPVRSHGYAGAESALYITQQCTPNLVMAPGNNDADFDELVSHVKRGVAAIGAGASTDFQGRTGIASGLMAFREIADGKLGPFLNDASISFSTADLWKNLVAAAGPRSVETIASSNTKGEPSQTTLCTVSAPAGLFKDLAIIDIMRKA